MHLRKRMKIIENIRKINCYQHNAAWKVVFDSATIETISSLEQEVLRFYQDRNYQFFKYSKSLTPPDVAVKYGNYSLFSDIYKIIIDKGIKLDWKIIFSKAVARGRLDICKQMEENVKNEDDPNFIQDMLHIAIGTGYCSFASI